ncbi:MAG TPA: NAD(P)-dependent oxidoreductase [Planctomicrobium sp.]|nr:NAD(P)-dependent oxidoreductase [Planctomicrobium sp.]
MKCDDGIGVIGLGLMGTAISERLLNFGYRVRVWNRTREKAAPLLARGAEWSDSPVDDCRRIIISLFDSQAVSEVIGAMKSHLREGQYLIDTTTGSLQLGILLERQMTEMGVCYLDAPLSGSSEQTRNGESIVIVSGDKSAFNDCEDLWPVLGKQTFHVGSFGSATKMKLVTNLILGLNRISLAEGLAFTEAIGVPPAAALQILKGSVAYSRVMDSKGMKMITGDFSVQARLAQHLKDVRLILQEGESAGISLPMSREHCRLLEQAVTEGFGDLDNSAIIQLFRRTAQK